MNHINHSIKYCTFANFWFRF